MGKKVKLGLLILGGVFMCSFSSLVVIDFFNPFDKDLFINRTNKDVIVSVTEGVKKDKNFDANNFLVKTIFLLYPGKEYSVISLNPSESKLLTRNIFMDLITVKVNEEKFYLEHEDGCIFPYTGHIFINNSDQNKNMTKDSLMVTSSCKLNLF